MTHPSLGRIGLAGSKSLLILLPAGLLLAACAGIESRNGSPQTGSANQPIVRTLDGQPAATSIGEGIRARAVEVVRSAPAARYSISGSREQWAALSNPFPPKPKKQRARSRFVGPGEESGRATRATRATQTTIESIDTQTNIDNTGGSLVIPADAHGAAGPNHVVAVTNVSIEFFQKDGTLQLSTSLRNFFSAVSPTTLTFDPKVLFDQYQNRWLVVTLERSDSPESSSILLAVSDDSDPNGSWTQVRIDSSVVIGANAHWFDYPGFAVDEEAVYLTGNMFRYFDGTSSQGSFGGVRLFIVEKGIAGGFYDGGATSVSVFDPVPPGASEVTLQPAHTFGAVPGSTGTWLTGWSGLNSGGNAAYQVIRVDDPLTAPSFTANFVFFGTVDDVMAPLPTAPQAGTATGGGNIGVATNDRRTLNAVWRDDGLWVAHSFLANSGADAGQVTAGWARIDTSSLATPTLDQFGSVGGEDIAAGAFTFFPAVGVNDDGGMMLGFSASASTINTGSYYAYRTPTDPPTTIRGSTVIRAGLDYYQRTFGGPSNRWGDYSSAVVDADGACFWIYNKYAISRGTSTGAGDDGRWGTAFAQFCNDPPTAADDAASLNQGQTVTTLDSGQASLLANDSDPDVSDLLIASTSPISGPDHAASFTLNDDGTFSYTHDNTANLVDAVVYEVCDDGSPIRCATATLQISITADNAAPTAASDSATVAEGGTVSVLDSGTASVLANDSDPNGDTLEVTGGAPPAPAHAAGLSLNPDGSFTYTHDGSETGFDAFGYEVCDDGVPVRCATASVNITVTAVNDPPIALDDQFLTEIGQPLSGDVSLNDSDVDSATLTYSTNTLPTGGNLTFNPDGTFDYVPDPGFFGEDSFQYSVSDGQETATASVTILVVDEVFRDSFES